MPPVTGYYFMAGPNKFCFGVQERKVAWHSRGFSDFKLASSLLACFSQIRSTVCYASANIRQSENRLIRGPIHGHFF